jgi:hypothetical protein
MKIRLLACLLMLTGVTRAQFTYQTDNSVPVIIDDRTLTMPWNGGLNTSQVNTLDLNHDDVDDLVIFDRTANKVITFLWQDDRWLHAPEYEAYFPGDVTSWMLLRDFNCDGKKDLFTRDPLGIKVYQNATATGELPAWSHFLFYSEASGLKLPVILTKGFSSKVNLQLNTDDLPSLGDADGDGDLDIFSPRFPGGATIEYHKNFSMERYGTCDSLDFERITTDWGNVTECSCGEFAFDEPCDDSGRILHAGGKALTAMDPDHDGDQDIFFSEESCNFVSLLENAGTAAVPDVNSTSLQLPGSLISIQNFPSVYFEDVDNDQVKDLIVSPNFSAHGIGNLGANLQSSTWFYKNTGTNEVPQFTFQQRDFLQREMLDVGDRSVPVFFDADGDGDLDLFIGYYALFFRGSIAYFENTGTQQAPAFTYVTNDLQGISLLNVVNVKPQFTDINGDNKTDLVFTATTLAGNQTFIFYILNNNGIGLNLSGQSVQNLDIAGLTLNPLEHVYFTRVDDDDLMDMLIGRQDGAVQFWKNNGTLSTPSFVLENGAYLGLSASTQRQNPACVVADLDDDNRDDLLFGDQRGVLTVISNFRKATAADAQTNLIFSSLQGTYTTQNLGGPCRPTVANLFKTDKPSIIVGNVLGGLRILKHDGGAALPREPQIEIFPNPVAQTSEKLFIQVDRAAALIVYSSLGQEIGEPAFFQAYQRYEFKPPVQHKGVYIFRFFIDGKTYSRRVIVY